MSKIYKGLLIVAATILIVSSLANIYENLYWNCKYQHFHSLTDRTGYPGEDVRQKVCYPYWYNNE